MSARDSFVIFKNWIDAINALPEEFQLETYKALTKYGITGEIPNDLSLISKALLISFSAVMEKNIIRYQASVNNGKLGGRPKKSDNQQEPNNEKEKPNETQQNLEEPTSNLNVNVNVNENVNDNVNVKKEKNIKKKFGKFLNVCLSDEEYQNLISEFGVKETDVNIEALSVYMESQGKTYKNHYAAVISFINRNHDAQKKDKQNSKSSNDFLERYEDIAQIVELNVKER